MRTAVAIPTRCYMQLRVVFGIVFFLLQAIAVRRNNIAPFREKINSNNPFLNSTVCIKRRRKKIIARTTDPLRLYGYRRFPKTYAAKRINLLDCSLGPVQNRGPTPENRFPSWPSSALWTLFRCTSYTRNLIFSSFFSIGPYDASNGCPPHDPPSFSVSAHGL